MLEGFFFGVFFGNYFFLKLIEYSDTIVLPFCIRVCKSLNFNVELLRFEMLNIDVSLLSSEIIVTAEPFITYVLVSFVILVSIVELIIVPLLKKSTYNSPAENVSVLLCITWPLLVIFEKSVVASHFPTIEEGDVVSSSFEQAIKEVAIANTNTDLINNFFISVS